jgi:D-glycero-alpha-D-manno-heptose-7-phosphate kinase
MKIVKSEAPVRIDLAGGTLDIPPLYLFHRPALTINMAIEIKARAQISLSHQTEVISHDQGITAKWNNPAHISWREYPGLELILRLIKSFNPKENIRVEIDSETPAGSGLGGSSAIAIALTSALAKWFNRNLPKDELVEYAKSIETQTIKVPTGYQDYWGAVYGKVHAYEMGLDGKLKLTPLGSQRFHRELERHLLLVYVGVPHFSGANNWELFKKHIEGNKNTVNFFEKLSENTIMMKEALESEEITRVAEILNKDWETRKAMLPTMTTPEIDRLLSETFQKGAIAARVCGAGGGGCVALLIKPDKRSELVRLVKEMNMVVIPAKISERGVTVQAL